MSVLRYISKWYRDLAMACAREFSAVFHDVGVLIFFFALPTLYPIVYTLIYKPEIVENLPVAIVDNSRTARSRELGRMIDATQSMKVIGYASDLEEARRWMNSHDCVAIFEIPSDYAKQLGRNDQAVVPFYCDMSLLLRYRAILSSVTDIQMQLGTEIRAELMDRAGMAGEMAMGSGQQVQTEAYFLGDTTQGFASFVMPGIFVLILQQSLILGVTMLAAGRRSRREPGGSPSALVIGRMLCYLLIYLPLVIYIFTIVPWMFKLPNVGNLFTYIVYILPMLIGASFLGMLISVFVTERESSMLVVVFTSVVFLFLTGLTWPRYSMNPFWKLVGDCIPATWGVEGFIRMASDGATMAEQAHPYHMMWLLAGIYFLGAWALAAFLRPDRKLSRP